MRPQRKAAVVPSPRTEPQEKRAPELGLRAPTTVRRSFPSREPPVRCIWLGQRWRVASPRGAGLRHRQPGRGTACGQFSAPAESARAEGRRPGWASCEKSWTSPIWARVPRHRNTATLPRKPRPVGHEPIGRQKRCEWKLVRAPHCVPGSVGRRRGFAFGATSQDVKRPRTRIHGRGRWPTASDTCRSSHPRTGATGDRAAGLAPALGPRHGTPA